MGIQPHTFSAIFLRLGLLSLLLLPARNVGGADVLPSAPTVTEALPDLRALKAGLRKSLLTALIPEMKVHRDALLVLEQKHGAAQNYAGAVQARDSRSRVEQQLAALEQEAAMLASRPSVESAARLAARIEFKLADAKLVGAQMDPADGAITGWDGAEASASWQLPEIPPGGYEVLLCYTGAAGDVVVKEGFYSLTSPCKAVDDKAVEQNLGTLRIKEGSTVITLTATPPEKCAKWRVYSLVLVPSAI